MGMATCLVMPGRTVRDGLCQEVSAPNKKARFLSGLGVLFEIQIERYYAGLRLALRAFQAMEII